MHQEFPKLVTFKVCEVALLMPVYQPSEARRLGTESREGRMCSETLGKFTAPNRPDP